MNPPNLNETERFYLASLMESARHGELETSLKAEDFYNAQNGLIFSAIIRQYQSGMIPDLVTLHADSALKEVSPSFIAEIANSGWTYTNIHYYEAEIRNANKTRAFTTALKTALDETSHDYTNDTDTIIKNLLPALDGVLSTRNEPGIKTAAQLLRTDFPPIQWVIPNLIGEGLTMLIGAPKIGKSWLALSLSLAVSQNGYFLGTLKTEPSEVLYLALEDTDRRIKNRLERLDAQETDNLKITTCWKDGYIGLRSYLSRQKDIRLVIIDTLARFAHITDMNAYTETTNALARIKAIADDLKIAIVVIHHAGKGKNRKAQEGDDWIENALGSTGLTGATDSTISIIRDRNGAGGELRVTGRDNADQKYPLIFDGDCGTWTITDDQQTTNTPKKKGRKKSEPVIDDGRDGWAL